uniref:Uncharacterized protein n=1 Tax=Anopheles darlingi TaxID=43151 RepID=A0A2M4DPS4_ANODA
MCMSYVYQHRLFAHSNSLLVLLGLLRQRIHCDSSHSYACKQQAATTTAAAVTAAPLALCTAGGGIWLRSLPINRYLMFQLYLHSLHDALAAPYQSLQWFPSTTSSTTSSIFPGGEETGLV